MQRMVEEGDEQADVDFLSGLGGGGAPDKEIANARSSTNGDVMEGLLGREGSVGSASEYGFVENQRIVYN